MDQPELVSCTTFTEEIPTTLQPHWDYGSLEEGKGTQFDPKALLEGIQKLEQEIQAINRSKPQHLIDNSCPF